MVLRGLASVAARSGDGATARDNAVKALELKPLHSAAVCALATVDVADSDYIAAEARLRPLISAPMVDPQDRAVAFGLLADALDGQDRCAQGVRRLRCIQFGLCAPQRRTLRPTWERVPL